MSAIYTNFPPNDYRSYLEHHGILGMKWGVRRFQDKNGSLTAAGKKRYSGIETNEDGKLPENTNSLKASQFNQSMIDSGWKRDTNIEQLYYKNFGDDKTMCFSKRADMNGRKVDMFFNADKDDDLTLDIPKRLREFEKNLPEANKIIKDKIVDDMYEERWDEDPSITRTKFRNGVKMMSVHINSIGDDVYVEANYDDGGFFYDHTISVEYSHRNKRAYYPSLQG